MPGPQFQIDQGCTWSFASDVPGVTWDLTVGVLRPHGRQQFDDFTSISLIQTPIPTYGDLAFWNLDNDLFAVKGDTFFEVGYIGASGDDTIGIIDAVMKLVEARLG